MKILAIETSTLTGSVALVEEDRVIGEITLSVSVQHSERLMPAVERLLQDAGVDIPSIDCFAVAVGPGSFTGVRIGIAAAQGLAMAAGKPIVGIPTLEALALNGIFFPGLIVPILNAYRGEVYRGLYHKVPGTFCTLEAVEKDRAIGIPELVQELTERGEETLLLGNGVELFGEEIRLAPPSFNTPRASNVAFLALQKYQARSSLEPPLPRYLRKAG